LANAFEPGVICQTTQWFTASGKSRPDRLPISGFNRYSLCLVFQTWIKNSRYHLTQGFIEARDTNHQSHLILDSITPSPMPDRSDTLITAMNQYDVTFAIRWYQTSPHNASWTNPTPPGPFPAMPPQRLPPPLESPSAKN
jgi:hypothetical protein